MTTLRTAATARLTLAAMILALAGASVAYRVLIAVDLEHTSLVFVGMPTILALILIAVQPKTTSGTVYRTITIALCLSWILFGEALICILMAAPIFYGVGAIVAKLSDKDPPLDETGHGNGAGISLKRLGILLFLPMSLEGVLPHFELPREHTVHVSRVVLGSAAEVRATLAAPMRFDDDLPLFFRLGFPTPGATAGKGLAIGDYRTIEFLHGGHHPGALRLNVTSSALNTVTFSATADDSYITHWLTWRGADVAWREVAPGRTEVVWTLRYWRRLDPAWYFAPLERYGVSLAARYLIESLATPATHH